MARRKRRRRNFGLVKHSAKKMASRYWKRYHAGAEQLRRSLSVGVYMSRGSRPTNTGRTNGFWAQACFGGAKSRGKSYKKCGPEEFGRSPTAAAKKALVALGRSKEVR